MQKVIKLIVFVCGLLLVCDGARAQDTVDSRRPFAIELPEINSGLLTEMDVYYPPNIPITRIKLWVVTPYDAEIDYGRIKATLNGKAVGPIAKRGAGLHGKFLDLDLRVNPDLRLAPGKNVVEIIGEDRGGKSYRASFVLLSGKPKASPSDPPPADAVKCEAIPAPDDPHALVVDRQPPQLTLIEPKAAIIAISPTLTVRVAGEASDDSGTVASVTANGQQIAASPTGTRGVGAKKKGETPGPATSKLVFDHTLTFDTNARALLVEARDRAGNRTLCTFPILRASAAASTGFGGRKFAVLIGVSEYKYNEGGLGDLSYSHKDAEAIRDFLRTPNGGNFRDEDILYLVNDQATLATVSDALKRFLTKAGPNDLVYLFLAGHGAPDPYDPQRLYFLLHDTKVADIPRTAFPMDRLREFLDQQKSQARLICFLDTCHSAGISQPRPSAGDKSTGRSTARGRGIGAKGIGAKPSGAPTGQSDAITDFNFYERRLFQEKGWAVITSSGRNETSQESPKWGQGHGVFTWALLEGLRGGADENRDCVITSGEIFKYVTERVRRETGNQQNPQSLPGANTALVIAATPGQQNCKR
jgi:uncharacterized caspase-like protein